MLSPALPMFMGKLDSQSLHSVRGWSETAGSGDAVASAERKIMGMVRYEYNVLGTRGPRKMTVLVPRPEPGSSSLPHGGSMTQRFCFKLPSRTAVYRNCYSLRVVSMATGVIECL